MWRFWFSGPIWAWDSAFLADCEGTLMLWSMDQILSSKIRALSFSKPILQIHLRVQNSNWKENIFRDGRTFWEFERIDMGPRGDGSWEKSWIHRFWGLGGILKCLWSQSSNLNPFQSLLGHLGPWIKIIFCHEGSTEQEKFQDGACIIETINKRRGEEEVMRSWQLSG